MKKFIQMIKGFFAKPNVNVNWVAVTERMPERGKTVIGYFPRRNEGGEFVATAISWNGETIISDFPNSTAHCFECSHWMEFPPPPNLR